MLIGHYPIISGNLSQLNIGFLGHQYGIFRVKSQMSVRRGKNWTREEKRLFTQANQINDNMRCKSNRNDIQCFLTFPNTKKRVENTTSSWVFLTKFEGFGNAMKHCLECLIRSNRENQVFKPPSRLWFPLLSLDQVLMSLRQHCYLKEKSSPDSVCSTSDEGTGM